jgi:hypothetical protein
VEILTARVEELEDRLGLPPKTPDKFEHAALAGAQAV